MAITLLAVEDQPVIQDRIRNIFTGQKEFELLGICSDGSQAWNTLSELKSIPDMLLVDLELPKVKGDELIQRCREKYPNLKIVVFTSFEEQNRILRLLKLGIKGYILKDTVDDLLIAELKVVYLGGSSLTERIAQKILEEIETSEELPKDAQPLTEREMEVINYISLGLNYRDIALSLDISPNTIRRHIENIYRKLEVNSKLKAVEKAKKMGLLKNEN